MFGCLPDEAERQDLVMVRKIMEYRTARNAVAAMNDGEPGQKRLMESPALGQMLSDLITAQQDSLED